MDDGPLTRTGVAACGLLFRCLWSVVRGRSRQIRSIVAHEADDRAEGGIVAQLHVVAAGMSKACRMARKVSACFTVSIPKSASMSRSSSSMSCG